MKLPLWGRFAGKLNSVDEAPEPLCGETQVVFKPGGYQWWGAAARCIGLVFLLLVVFLSVYALYTIEDNNLHVVVAGQVYRSGQMDTDDFTRCVKEFGIKSILNLRGVNPTTSWHQAEIATAAKLNVLHYDRSLGSGTELTLQQMDDLVTLLRQAPKPILIHCQGGADRSGLVSGLYCYAIDGETAGQADRQLTIWYGHVPLIRPKVAAMDRSFWHYVTNRTSSANQAGNILDAKGND